MIGPHVANFNQKPNIMDETEIAREYIDCSKKIVEIKIVIKLVSECKEISKEQYNSIVNHQIGYARMLLERFQEHNIGKSEYRMYSDSLCREILSL